MFDGPARRVLRGLGRGALVTCVLASCSQDPEPPPAEASGGGGQASGGSSGGKAGEPPRAGEGGTRGGGVDAASAGGAAGSAGSGAPPDAGPVLVDAAAPDARPVTGRSAGCAQAATGSGTWQAQAITVRSVARSYRLFVPRTYAPSRAYPLVFVLHGSGGSGTSGDVAAFASTSKEDAILIAPSGVDGKWSLEVAGPDFELLDALRARLGASHCIDETRVFSYGFSLGGAMSTVYACGRPGVLRAFASQRGGLPGGMPPCGPSAAWLANSATDGAVVPAWYQPVHDAFVKLDGCSAATQPTTPSPCVERQGCSAGHELVECAITGPHNPEPGWAIPAAWSFFTRLK